VSHQTVSRVLNDSPLVREETRTRVLAAIEELGYRRNMAARMLATNRSGRIGVIAAHLVLYGPSMIGAAVQDAGNAAGYEVSLAGLPEPTVACLDDAIDRMLDQAVEALVEATWRAAEDHKDVLVIAKLAIPLVMAQGVSAGQSMAAGVDQVAGARLATEHLLDLGHETVWHVSGPPESYSAIRRQASWEETLLRHGRTVPPVLAGDWTVGSGYRAGLELAGTGGVTAVFAANDQMALGVLHALHELGRPVPSDVSVVGFDDMEESAHFWPPLTTVRQSFVEVGKAAVDALINEIQSGEHDREPLRIGTELVVRKSTAPPRSTTG